MQKNEIKLLTDREHVLKRPARYVGSVKNENKKQWVLSQEDKFVFKEEIFNPGFKKVFREIVDNSIDEGLRTSFKFANKLKITINQNKNEFIIEDNGRGIPFYESKVGNKKITSVELAFTHLKAGSNFDDSDDNTTIGQNGEGSSLTNILSELFIAESCDGNKKTTVSCEDNMGKIKTRVVKGTKKFTRITYRPSLEFFNLKDVGIPDYFINSLKVDFHILSQVYPKLTIELTVINKGNKSEKIIYKNESFATFMNRFISVEQMSEVNRPQDLIAIEETNGLKIGVFANQTDEQLVFHSINGLTVYRGNPLTWVQNSFGKPLMESLSKKYKSIKIGDIKQKLSYVVLFDGMTNPRFNSQTKEECVNTYTDFKNNIGNVDFIKLANKVFKNKKVLEPLIEMHNVKSMLEERKALKGLKPEKKRIFIEKYYKSSGKLEKAGLVLTEGDSALSGIMGALGRTDFSFFPLKGKPLNVREQTNAQITKNNEIKSILQILNLDITKDESSINHDSIVIATDADADGNHIAGLLLNLFQKFAPHLIKAGKIKLFRTPMIVATPKTGSKSKKILIYNFKELFEFEQNNDSSKYTHHYYKGLGSWTKKDLQDIIKEYGIDNFIVPFKPTKEDNNLNELFDSWFSKDESTYRKDQIRDLKFLIEKA